MLRNKLFWIILLLLVFATQAIYISTLLPDIGWGDGPELTTTAYTLGIAHPTGYSNYTLLTHLFAHAGSSDSAAWRVNYFSAFSATCAILVFFILLYRHFLNQLSNDKYRLFISASGSLLLAFSGILWSQSVTTEVYSFQLLLFLTIFLLFAEWMKQQEIRFLYGSLFFMGLGFTHHLLTIVIVPVFLLLCVLKKDLIFGNKKTLTLLVAFFILGFFSIIYLPIRAAHYPVMNWGNVQTFPALLNSISGGQFKLRMLSTAPGMGMANTKLYQGMMMSDLEKFFDSVSSQFIFAQIPLGIVSVWIKVVLNLSFILVLFAGLCLLWSHNRFLFGSTILIFLAVMVVITNYHILDIEDYYIPAIAVVVLCFTFGLSKIMSKLFQYNLVCVAILLLICCVPLFSNYSEITKSQNKSSFFFGRNILESVEDNALIITGGDNDIFPLWYWKYVHGLKPNVTIFGGNFLTSPWYSAYFQGKDDSFHFQLSNGLYQSQADWANALNENVISSNIKNRPVYTTLYDPYVAKQYEYILVGDFIPDATKLPEYQFLSSSKLFHLYSQRPDYSIASPNGKYSRNVKFDNTITLLDCVIDKKDGLHAGDVINVDYYWRKEKESNQDYKALVIYPDEKGMVMMENDKPSFVQEFQPLYDIFPTSQWKIGSVYKESYKVMIPLLLINPGKITITLSMRDGNKFASAILLENTTPQKTVSLDTLEILP